MADRKTRQTDLSPTEARQGEKANRVNRVLVLSVLLAVVALAIVLWAVV